jgi:hypothetical protein
MSKKEVEVKVKRCGYCLREGEEPWKGKRTYEYPDVEKLDRLPINQLYLEFDSRVNKGYYQCVGCIREIQAEIQKDGGMFANMFSHPHYDKWCATHPLKVHI